MFGDKPVGISEDFGVCPLDFQNQKKTFFFTLKTKKCFHTFISLLFLAFEVVFDIKKAQVACTLHF